MSEEEMKMELEMRRRETRTRQTATKAASQTRINPVGASLILGLALLADILDYLVIGDIPIVGDVIDLIAGGSIWFWVKISIGTPWYISWSPGIATLVELIPFIGDLPPSFTLDVLFIITMNTSWGRRWAKILSPI